MIKKLHKISPFIYSLCAMLIIFNYYYFFFQKGVGLKHYVIKYLHKPYDNITDNEMYKDLSEEYSYMNKKYEYTKTVFTGDSITKRFNIQEFSDNYKIINRGIFSDTTQGLICRLDTNINTLNIDKLFLMIGYNDLEFRTNNEIISNIRIILHKLKSKHIYIQSLLPVGSERIEINDRIIKINEQLKQMSNGNTIDYIDLHSHFKTTQNYMKPELTIDGIHPNFSGYKLWFSLIEPLL